MKLKNRAIRSVFIGENKKTSYVKQDLDSLPLLPLIAQHKFLFIPGRANVPVKTLALILNLFQCCLEPG